MSGSEYGRRLQVCRVNRLARQGDALRALEEMGWRVEIEECLDRCTRCEGCAFALVSGEYLFARNEGEFLKRIQKVRQGKLSGKGGASIASQ